MQNNENIVASDITQLSWADVLKGMETGLNENHTPSEDLSFGQMKVLVGDMATQLHDAAESMFVLSPNIAERDMEVRSRIDIHIPSSLDDEDDALFAFLTLEFSYIKGVDGGAEVVATEIATLEHVIGLTFDPNTGFHTTVDCGVLYGDMVPKANWSEFLTEDSISDYVDMLEAEFVEAAVEDMLCLPDSVGTSLVLGYCAEAGIEMECCEDGEGGEPTEPAGEEAGPAEAE